MSTEPSVEALLGLVPIPIGTRVRVRIGGEGMRPLSGVSKRRGFEIPISARRLEGLGGAVGTVVENDHAVYPGRPYAVDLDEPRRLRALYVVGVGRVVPSLQKWVFARSELERL